jgi:phospholipid/cholesterol/gamma-HCH transport system substrate-binding protein
MSAHQRFLANVLKMAAAAVVSAILFIIVLSAMRSPVAAPTNSYSAEFTDVSGLHVNGDIRTKGVRIGKVQNIDLVLRDGRRVARVDFTMDRSYELTDNTTLAVKYQNLTGVRYVDVQIPDERGRRVTSLPVAQTTPSFDITQLFNGLQPVLATMSTDEINTFTENAIMLLQGDGAGLAPMLDSAQQLADLAHDREQVISALTDNLSRISDSMGGKSPQTIEFLRSVSFPIAKAMTVLEEFPKTATYGPEFLTPIKRLIDALGLQPGMDIDAMLSDAFASIPDAAEALRLLPASFAGLNTPQTTAAAPQTMRCTNGVAQLPSEVEVFLNGSGVVLCNAQQ